MMINEKGQKASKMIAAWMIAAQVALCIGIVLPVFAYTKALFRGQLTLGLYFIPFALYVLIMLCYVWMVLMMSKVFKTVREEQTPFVESNVNRLKKIAVLAGGLTIFRILGSLLLPIWFLPSGFLVIGGESLIGFDFSALSYGAVRAVDVSSVGLGVTALLVYGIALFTQYGVELQKQADETF